jgi:hypothetical protein
MDQADQEQPNAGGAATQAGVNFQNRVAAWVATRILCDTDRNPIFGLSAVPNFLRCETEQPVDDLLVGSRSDSFGYAQIKHSIDLSDSPNSVLAEVVDQFTRQILRKPGPRGPQRPWDTKPDPERDSLVLIVGPAASGSIREHLRTLLEKIRLLLPQQSLSEAASNVQQSRALEVITGHFSRSYNAETGASPSNAELRNGLRLMRVEVLDADATGTAERESLDALRQVVLRSPDDATAAWSTVIQACARMAETHSGADQAGLRKLLQKAGFSLNTPASYASDVEQLHHATTRTEAILSNLGRIEVGQTIFSIDREVTTASPKLRTHSSSGSLEPGNRERSPIFSRI